MTSHPITRREFLRKTGAAAIAATAGVPLLARGEVQKSAKVILIRNENVINGGGTLNGKILEEMLDQAVTHLLDVKTPADAWKKIIRPTDVVGIKTNVWRYLRTPVELENAMKTRILAVGVDEKNISIDDWRVLSNPVFAKATALINARPMRAHNWSGVGGCLKNYIMFTPSPSDYHPDSCIDLGAIWNLPAVKGKTRLNVLVMLTPQFNCLGPHHFDKEFTWPYKGLLVGTDPVALDAVGLKIIEAKRRLYFSEETPMRPPVRHIRAAEEKHGVGVADLNRIEIVKLGWKENLLV
jgi:hypothetical protein